MRLMFNGKEYFGPRGPAGPDGSPIGTIISYMGKTAPKDYLVCDGSIYGLSDYPDLAKFFTKQFGSSNYFGGDGAVTFAVPDMRNLFLRGYHGEGEEQLSGDIGVKQDGTEHPYLWGNPDIIAQIGADRSPNNIDMFTGGLWPSNGASLNTGTVNYSKPLSYTSHPVNMAILYCIKAAESFQAQDIYSTEEHRIGTWIDGKPLYRKVFYDNSTRIPELNGVLLAENVDFLVHQYGVLIEIDSEKTSVFRESFPYENIKETINTQLNSDNDLRLYVVGDFSSYILNAIFEYTKTTDQDKE